MAGLEYGCLVAEDGPRQLAEDFVRQANLMEEAEARGFKTRLERDGLEVLLGVEGGIGALVALCGWAMAGGVRWPDRLLVEGDEEEEEAEAALENDARTRGYVEVVQVA